MKSKFYTGILLLTSFLFILHSCDNEEYIDENLSVSPVNSEVAKSISDFNIQSIDVNYFYNIAKQKSSSYVNVDLQIDSHPNWKIPMNFMDIESASEGDIVAYEVGEDNILNQVQMSEQLGLKSEPVSGDQFSFISINDKYLEATIIEDNDIYKIEPLFYYDNNAKDDQYVIYNVKDLKPTDFSCKNDSFKQSETENNAQMETKSGRRYAVALTMVADYQFYRKFNNYYRTYSYMINRWVESSVNSFGFYNGATNVRLLRKNVVYIYTSYASRNYYPNAVNNYITFVQQCAAYYNAPWFQSGQVNYFFTGDNVNGVWGAAVGTGTVCKSPGNSFAFGENLPSGFQTSILLSHELGHLFGASHTNSGPMGIGLNSLAFNPTSKNQINTYVSNNHNCMW